VLILRFPHHQWSLLLIGEEEDDGMRWRSSWCPSLDCLALSAEQRPKDGLKWNDLSSNDCPTPRSDLISYIMR
jgi:hypothetical protein